MKLQFLMYNMMSFLGESSYDYLDKSKMPPWVADILAPILKVLDSLLLPVIIVLGTAGMIYGIVLGVQFAKAETADKREEAKKRMINAIIGIVIMLILLILAKVFTSNAPDIFQWVTDSASGNPTGGAGE